MDWYCDQQEQLLIRKTREYCRGLVSFQDLKEFSVLNVMDYLDSVNPTIAELIREIEGSVVEVDEEILTEEEFKNNLQNILADVRDKQEQWTASSAAQLNFVTFSWKSANPAPTPTTFAKAVIA